MSIERYKGIFISAEDATETIDLYTITDGCKMMKQASQKLEEITQKIDRLKTLCNEESLLVGNSNMKEIIETYEQNTKNFYIYINNLSETLQTTAQRVTNRKQVILNEEARRLDEREQKLHKSMQNDSPEEVMIIEEKPKETIMKDQPQQNIKKEVQ